MAALDAAETLDGGQGLPAAAPVPASAEQATPGDESGGGLAASDSWRSWDQQWDWWSTEPRDQEAGQQTSGAQASGDHGAMTAGSQNGVAASAMSGSDPWQVVDPWSTAHDAQETSQWRQNSYDGWWRSSSWGSSWNWQQQDSQSWDRTDWQWGQWSSSKPDYSDPPTWPGWSHRRLWVQAIRRWNKQTDVPVHKRSEKVLRSFGWEMQIDFEHLSDDLLSSSDYLEAIVNVINNKAGVREDDDKRRAYKQAITDNQRHRDETLAQFSVRRMRDFNFAANYGMQIPDGLKAMLLREGAGLSDQSQQNLAALVSGREEDPDAVARALARLDVRSDRLVAYTEDALDEGNYLTDLPVENHDEEEIADEEEVIRELDGLELSEDQITEVFAVLEQRRRTWRENKILKADIKKDRGSIMKDGGASYPRGQQGGPPAGGVQGRFGKRRAMNRSALKKISKCRLCHKVGHWAEDCHLNNQQGQSSGKKSHPTAFVYCGEEDAGKTAFTFLSVGELRSAISAVLSSNSLDHWSFLTLPGGEAVVDIGATQDLIGSEAMKQLNSSLNAVGLQSVRVNKPIVTPSGIGGSAKALYVALLPISPGGAPGVLEVTVLEGHIPPLLSVGFLEHLGAKIDLITNEIYFENLKLGMRMKKLTSGHRTIPLVQWSGDEFPVPDEVQHKYGLQPGAFNLPSAVSCAYTKDAAASTSMSVDVANQENYLYEPNDVCFSPLPEVVSRHVAAVACHEHSCCDVVASENLKNENVCHDSNDILNHAQHDADPQCLQPDRSSYLMGGTVSQQPQFDLDSSRHGARLSSESRDEQLPCGGPASRLPQLGTDDASFGNDVGNLPSQLQDVGPCRASHESLPKQEAIAARGTCRGILPSPLGTSHSPIQSIRGLDSVREVPSSGLLSVEEVIQQGQGQRQDSSVVDNAFDRTNVSDPEMPLTPSRTVAPSAPVTPTPTSRASSSETNMILQQALESFQLQGSQMGQMMMQINVSLQDLSRGQAQMLTMVQPSPTTPQMEEETWSSVTDMEMPNPNVDDL